VESKGAARRGPQFVGVLAKTPFCSLALAEKGNRGNGKEGRDESRPYIAATGTRNSGLSARCGETCASEERDAMNRVPTFTEYRATIFGSLGCCGVGWIS
jgi:hypothetical protein